MDVRRVNKQSVNTLRIRVYRFVICDLNAVFLVVAENVAVNTLSVRVFGCGDGKLY